MFHPDYWLQHLRTRGSTTNTSQNRPFRSSKSLKLDIIRYIPSKNCPTNYQQTTKRYLLPWGIRRCPRHGVGLLDGLLGVAGMMTLRMWWNGSLGDNWECRSKLRWWTNYRPENPNPTLLTSKNSAGWLVVSLNLSTHSLKKTQIINYIINYAHLSTCQFGSA